MAGSNKAEPVTGTGVSSNKAASTKQKRLAVAVLGTALVALVAISLLRDGGDGPVVQDDESARYRLTDATRRNPGDQETLEGLSDQVGTANRAIAKIEENDLKRLETLTALNSALESLRQEVRQGGSGTSGDDALLDRIAQLEARLDEQNRPGQGNASASPRLTTGPVVGGGGPTPLLVPPTSQAAYRAPGEVVAPGAARAGADTLTRRSQKIITLGTPSESSPVEEVEDAVFEALSDVDDPDVFKTANYIPPNAHAPAVVYVGVDAGTGSAAQADPQVAAFLIDGPAKHVVADGRIQETDLTGCLVNGAATGDLSTERVFIKLQKMTCPLADGRVAVSTVEGHVTSNGKSGVRGQIVSRQGDLLTTAMIAALAEGVGGATSRFGQGGLGIGAGGGLSTELPSSSDIAISGVGGGVAAAGDTVSQYVLDRARAYDPVVQMPTGVRVELVFINGTLVRPKGEVPN